MLNVLEFLYLHFINIPKNSDSIVNDFNLPVQNQGTNVLKKVGVTMIHSIQTSLTIEFQ